MPPVQIKIAEVTNIEPADVEKAAQDYRDINAEVQITSLPNGKMKLEAWVQPGAKYPASGEFLR
ncbi:MAG: hypothetical protein QOG12_1609 [Verrucomicrobiota bacterium]|jgi:hypothetical protein